MWGRGEEDLFGVDELQHPFLSLTMCLRKRSRNLKSWTYLALLGWIWTRTWMDYTMLSWVTHSNFHLVMKISNLNQSTNGMFRLVFLMPWNWDYFFLVFISKSTYHQAFFTSNIMLELESHYAKVGVYLF